MSKCYECTYLKVDGNIDYGKFWCEKMDWKYAYEDSCRYFCSAYGRSNSAMEQAVYHSENRTKRGCYITTALCSVLSMPDDNIYLQSLRKLRDNYLQKTKEGLEILAQYDIVGPKISENILKDCGKFNLSLLMLNNYVAPTTSFVLNGKYDDATKIYLEMTQKLIKFYEIDNQVDVDINELEPSLSGHGVLVKKQ